MKIEKINVKDLGPVKKFDFKPANLNLVYGKNETGKTFIVEFLIRALFKNKTGMWDLRKGGGNGKVTLGGLGEENKVFSPKSDLKLSDFLKDSFSEITPELSRLMIVKGSKIKIDPDSAKRGVSLKILKKLLSGSQILDQIFNRLSKTVGRAKIESEDISVSSSTNLVKNKDNTFKKLKNIEQILKTINKKYAGGPVQRYSRELEKTNRNLKRERMAKRYLAYSLTEKIKELGKKLKKRRMDRISSLKDKVSRRSTLLKSIEDKKNKLEKLADSKDNYAWTENAAELYGELKKTSEFKKWKVGIMTALLVLAASFIFIEPWVSAGIIIIGIVFNLVKDRMLPAHREKQAELNRIKKNYMDKFGEKLKDLPTLKSKKEELAGKKNRYDILKDDLKQLNDDLQKLEEKIDGNFLNFTGENLKENEWRPAVNRLEEEREELNNELSRKKERRAGLNISEDNFIKENPGYKYSKDKEAKLITQKEQVQKKLDDEKEKLKNLKFKIINILGEEDTGPKIDFSELINRLRSLKEKIVGEYRDLTSKLIAESTVYKSVKELNSREEKKIKENLKTKDLQSILYKLTGRYNRFYFREGDVVVSDKYSDFKLPELSTGAFQQVLLALRVGIIKKLFKTKRAFFILDDAFQYSDYKRRESMVEFIINLAQNGWQVIYFTMDDHIKDLFRTEGKKELAEDFKYLNMG